MMEVRFEQEKETKGTIRFKEANLGPLDSPQIGTLYVPKPTLKDLGWEPGKTLVVSISID